MARGAIQVKQGYCPHCGLLTKCERNSLVWGGGDLILIVFSFGGWLVLKLLWNALVNSWRCSRCGSPPGRRPAGLVNGRDPLARMPEPMPPRALPDAAARMHALEDMLRRGLISQDEYGAKRAEILRSL